MGDAIFSLLCIGSLFFIPLYLLGKRIQSLESEQKNLKIRNIDLDLRLQNLESETTPEKPKETEPEMEDLPPVLDTPVDPPDSITQEPTFIDSADTNIWGITDENWSLPAPPVQQQIEDPGNQPPDLGSEILPNEPATSQTTQTDPQTGIPTEEEPTPTEKLAEEPKSKTSFELQLGKVWFVRIGVVMVLTGIAYLAQMGYKGLDVEIRPYINAAMLYLISFGMMGAGLFLHRKFEFLKNYSEVITGGGMAAVYFTTYALYFVKSPDVLGLIKSPIIAGELLAAWAIFIIWFATQKKSEVIALFAVAGAYYSSYIPLSHEPTEQEVIFIFASNAALALTTLFFLIRNRWANLSFLATITSYGGFAYWRFGHAVGALDFWQDTAFLGVFWIIFTVAGFLSRNDQLSAAKRATFVNLNNGAFFALMTILMLQVHDYRDDYWLLPLIFSGITLALYFAAKKLLRTEELFGEIMLGKSALLGTLAIMTFKEIAEYRGLLLAAESVTILFFGLRTKNRILQWASTIVASIGVVFVLMVFNETVKEAQGNYYAPTLRLGIFFSLLMLSAGIVAEKWKIDRNDRDPLNAMPNFFAATGFTVAIIACFVTVLKEHTGIAGLGLAGLGLITLAASRVIRIGAVFVFAKIYTISGFIIWLTVAFSKNLALEYWQAPLMLLIACSAQQLHQRHKNKSSEPQPHLWSDFNNHAAQILYAVFMGVISIAWMLRLLNFEFLNFPMALTAGGIIFTFYAYALRSTQSYALGQVILSFGICLMSLQLVMPVTQHTWAVSLIPAAVALALSVLLKHKPNIITGRLQVSEAAINVNGIVLQAIGNLSGLVVALKFIPEEYQLWILPLIGVALSIVYLKLNLVPSIITAQAFVITSALIAPLRMFVMQPEMWSTLFPVVVMLLMSHFLLHSSNLIEDKNHPLRKLGKGGTQLYFYYGWTLCLVWGIKFVPEDFRLIVFTIVSIAHGLAHKRRERTERLIVAGAFLLVGVLGFWIHAVLNWDSPRPADGLALIILLGVHTAWRKITRDNQNQAELNLTVIILINTSLWIWTSSMVPGDWDIIGWGVLAFALVGLGLWSPERTHRLFGLVVLLASTANLMLLAYSRLDGASRILTFIGMGIILIILGGLYHKFQEKIKELI